MPDVAWRVIPALLEHQSEALRITAITLLRDLGTDEAIDELVKLLGDDRREAERPYIAWLLAGLIKTSISEIKKRKDLLPPRQDETVWPLDDYFPARLAIPIAEGLASSGRESGIYALDCAARVISEKKSSDRRFLKQWHNAGRDLVRMRRVRVLGNILRPAVLAL
jgi:HEAT repeat protein